MRVSSHWLIPVCVLVPISLASADGGAQHRTKQTPPVKMGTSGGSLDDHSSAFCCGGTLGALVTRDGVLSILSNNHVLGRSGTAVAGEDTLQPALIDTGCNGNNSNIVGDYAGNIVPLGTANVDATISTARNNVDSSGAILDIGVPCSTIQNASIGMPVMKSGRTTGFNTGSVTSINTSVQVQYQKGCNSGKKFTVVFTNQIVTNGSMSQGGDSGSVLYSNDGTPNPVGLLFAGSGTSTIFNKAQEVANAFSAGGHSFAFVGNNCGPAPDVISWPTPSNEEVLDALTVKVENESDLFQIKGVLGVGVGALEDNPIAAAIVVYVEAPQGQAPKTIPSTIDGVPVRVITTDKFVAQ